MFSATSGSAYLLSARGGCRSSPVERVEQDGGLVRDVLDRWQPAAKVASQQRAVDVSDVLARLRSAGIAVNEAEGRSPTAKVRAHLKLELPQMRHEQRKQVLVVHLVRDGRLTLGRRVHVALA